MKRNPPPENRGRRVRDALGWVLSGAALAAFYWLNRLTWYMRDDYSYRLSFLTKEPIGSVADIFGSLGIHYYRVNGRLPLHFLAHLFLWLGKPGFDIVNTLAFCALAGLVCFHIRGRLRPMRPMLWFAVFLGLWVLTPAYGESFLWITGASNYLYGMLIILLFLVPYRVSAGETPRDRRGPAFSLLYFPFGVLAGWTNENTAGALGLVLLALLVRQLHLRRPVAPWMLTGLAGVACGLGLMVLGPGELGRLAASGGTGGASELLARFLTVTKDALRHLWPGIALFALLLVRFFRTGGKWRALFLPGLYALAGLASLYAMCLSPMIPDRVWSGPVLWFLISGGCLYAAQPRPVLPKPWLRYSAALLAAGALALSFYIAAPRVAATGRALRQREAEGRAQLAAGETVLHLPPVLRNGTRFDGQEQRWELQPDPDNWLNVALARYLGAEQVIAD